MGRGGVSDIYHAGSMFRLRGTRNDGASYKTRRINKGSPSSEPKESSKVINLRRKLRNTLGNIDRLDRETRKTIAALKSFSGFAKNERQRHRIDQYEQLAREKLVELTERRASLSVRRDELVAQLNTLTRAAQRSHSAPDEPPFEEKRPITPPESSNVSGMAGLFETELPVPTPDQRVTPDSPQFAREGQADFRSQIVDLYGCCAVTGCIDQAALQAAHIMPFVDTRSHIVTNGICLRADIHLLFDRGLLSINEEYQVEVSPDVQTPCYRELAGRKISLPQEAHLRPDKRLLALRSRFI